MTTQFKTIGYYSPQTLFKQFELVIFILLVCVGWDKLENSVFENIKIGDFEMSCLVITDLNTHLIKFNLRSEIESEIALHFLLADFKFNLDFNKSITCLGD